MRIIDTQLDGPLLVEPAVHGDQRGFFAETYRANVLAELGIRDEFVQDNHSRSGLGVVRGMHFAVGDGQAKLVRCVRGAVADVTYKLSTYYDPATETGVAFNDPEVDIRWPDVELVYSERDASAPLLSEIAAELPFSV